MSYLTYFKIEEYTITISAERIHHDKPAFISVPCGNPHNTGKNFKVNVQKVSEV